MSTSINGDGPFSGRFDARVFLAIFVPAVFLFIIILTMLVFLIYRQPAYYDSYITDPVAEQDDQEKFDWKFEIMSRAPMTNA